jgi:hypothetical protein
MNRKGFTLIDLLFIIAIVGIMFVTATHYIKKSMDPSKQNPTPSLNTTTILSTNSKPSENWQISRYDELVRYKQLTDYLFIVEYDGVIYIYNYQGGIIKHR